MPALEIAERSTQSVPAEALPTPPGTPLYPIPVYEVRLVKARRPLMLAAPTVADNATAARALHGLIAMTDREHLACLFLNGNHEVTGAHIVAIGAQPNIGHVDVRVLFRAAIAACASAVVVGHNHPSGDPSPSNEDIAATAGMMRAGRALSIPVLDHVIVTRERSRFYSMHRSDTLPKIEP